MCWGGGETPSPCLQVKINYVLLILITVWDAESNVQLKILWVFKIPVVFFVTFLTIFDSLVLENCRMGLLFQRLCVQCLAMLSNPCLFPALGQGSRHKAKGSMWRVCSKDVGMNHFTQLTFQPGNQTCL